MFEFHGWAVIRYHTHDTDLNEQRRSVDAVRSLARSHQHAPLISSFAHNGCEGLSWHGTHNRRGGAWALELLKQIGSIAPGSYGVLYVLDDEASAREERNGFGIWVLRRGEVSKHADELLSPFVPRCEDPHDPSRDD
jgi:hypothetical protein